MAGGPPLNAIELEMLILLLDTETLFTPGAELIGPTGSIGSIGFIGPMPG